MANFDVQPDARLLWCLRRRATDVRCLMVGEGIPVEVQVVHGGDVLLTEIFQESWMAVNWAEAYRARLREQGWQDVPGGHAGR